MITRATKISSPILLVCRIAENVTNVSLFQTLSGPKEVQSRLWVAKVRVLELCFTNFMFCILPLAARH